MPLSFRRIYNIAIVTRTTIHPLKKKKNLIEFLICVRWAFSGPTQDHWSFPREIWKALFLVPRGLAAASSTPPISLLGFSPQKVFSWAQFRQCYVLFVCSTIAVWLLRLAHPSVMLGFFTYYSKLMSQPKLPGCHLVQMGRLASQEFICPTCCFHMFSAFFGSIFGG